MRYWYGYTGESLLLGHGRTIRYVVPHPQELERLLKLAHEDYQRHAEMQRIDARSFIAALVAPLAVLELGVSSPSVTSFSSAGQVLRLFEDRDIQQVAAQLFNGRMASAYAAQGDADAIAARVVQGFQDGELLVLPRDEVRLHTQEVLNTLPGAVVFLLSRAGAQSKAFADYLRRGTIPVIPRSTVASLTKMRPILRTWEREARLKRQAEARP